MVSFFAFLRVPIGALRNTVTSSRRVSKRIKQSPGLPVANPTSPFWSIAASVVQKEGSSAAPPSCADVVIIRSGITGTAFAHTLLEADQVLDVVMLEAQDACSGSTARNGGHITSPLYHDYLDLKKKHGTDAAKQIIQFRLSHLDELISVTEEEGLTEESQCRKVESYEVVLDKECLREPRRNAGCAGSSRRRATQCIHIGSHTLNLSIHTEHIIPSPWAWTTDDLLRSFVPRHYPPIRLILYDPVRSPAQRLCLADTVGCADDSQVEFRISAHPGGALVAYFGKRWGGESAEKDEHFERGRGRVKAWSGILGMFTDGLPWAGSLVAPFYSLSPNNANSLTSIFWSRSSHVLLAYNMTRNTVQGNAS